MAVGLIALIGDALSSFLDLSWPEMRPEVGRAAERLAVALRPDPPFEVYTSNGEVVTGLLVAERGRVLLFVGQRCPPSSSTSTRRPQDQP